jgi:predicted O-linked N-acetylglucosamine transferase (SPINDLY family)
LPELTIQQAFDHALTLQNTGHLADAEAVYRQIISVDPKHINAMQMLGVLLAQTGRPDAGLELVRQASRLNPAAASCHTNIGMILAGQGQLPPAVESFKRALQLRPNSSEMHNNLANALTALGRFDEAIASYVSALALNPNFPQAHNNLGTALCARDRTDEGIASFRKAIQLKPDYVEGHYNLAKALYERRDLEAAITSVEKSLSLRPDYPEALTLHGVLLQSLGHHDAAIATYQRSLALRPQDSETLNNLATAHLELRQYDLAIETYRKAIAANPNNAEPHGNLGRALGECGQLDQALALYRKSLELKPQSRTASGLLLFLHLHPDITPRQILEEHREWNRIYAQPLAPLRTHYPNDPSPHRRIRLAYVSPDFTNHPVGRFMLPILSHHNREHFEIICYSDTRATDANTDRLRQHADQWRDTSRLSDHQLAAQIREDRVDLLVDLLMHAKGCRLLAFAEKPAPVQLTYLSYCSTTGINAMDYRITDPYLDPPGIDESIYTEKTLRLPDCFWCFQPAPEAPALSPLPALANGYITFGCLNNFWKVTPGTLNLWFELLARVPHSRLLLHAHEGDHRQRLRHQMAARNLDPGRVEFVGFQPLSEYLAQHARIDIALDPFPYGGGTTTCESLWMGAPVITLPAQTAVSRAGVSILSNVGLQELIASSKEDYLQIATALANDLHRLANLRSTLRDRMQSSPLMNPQKFTIDLESIYRQSWQTWCKAQSHARA